MNGKIPITVIVTTLNEEKNLPRCLAALSRFDEILVVDSGSKDNSRAIVESSGATFIDFHWNGQYPKKRQWCLDKLPLKHDHIFFVDADEEVTVELAEELANLEWSCAGYFVDGLYVVDGKVLKHGIRNSKLCLFDRCYIEFPVVDDLDLSGMGEIEGHYQPVFKINAPQNKLGKIKNFVLHHAFDDLQRWQQKHEGYAEWERGMLRKNTYPKDPSFFRHIVKNIFYRLPCKGRLIFAYYYIFKGGFLDGNVNLAITSMKMKYYDR